jgi:hypothetical protein
LVQIGHPMESTPEHRLIAALIASAARSARRSDRFDAVAVEWLRRWRPEKTLVALPECSCPAGRCGACN